MRSTAGLPFLLSAGMQVHLVPPVLDAPRVVTVLDAEPDGVDGGVVWFEEVGTADEAKVLVGCHCLIPRPTVEKLTRHAFVDDGVLDIAGYEAYDEFAGYLGLVSEIREMPGQMMIIIARGECSPLMVPLVDEFVQGIDEDGRTLRLCLPAGLLSL